MSDQIQNLQQFATTQLGMTPQKPLIKLPGNGVQIRDTATDIYKLAGAQHGLFYSNGLVAKVQRLNAQSLPTLVPLAPAVARSEFEKYARFGKPGSQARNEGLLSEGDAKAILLCDNAKDLLPNVTGLLNHPLPILHNGQLEILQSGYNARTGYLVADGQITEPDTVEEAAEIIEAIFRDFKFQSPSDFSRAIACFLTPALKLGSFIQGKTPMNIIEANESQTGKGFLLHLRTLVYGEVPIMIARQKGGVGSMDESFAAALLSGRPFIQIDNIRGELNSELVETFITNCGSLLVRVPFFGPQLIDGSLRFVAITSNGMVTTEDLVNRASFIRLEKEANREFTFVNEMGIEDFIPKNRDIYMGAITKIIRHYHEQGMPKTNEKRHDAREWVQKLDWIVQNIFHFAPLMDGHEAAQKRVQSPALGFVRVLANEVAKIGRLGVELKAQELADICEAGGVEIPGLNKKGTDGYTEKQEAQRIGQLMGLAFVQADQIEVEAYRISRTERLGLTSTGTTFPGKRYEFVRINEEAAAPQEEGDNYAI